MSVLTTPISNGTSISNVDDAEFLAAVWQQVSLAVSLNSNAISLIRQENDYFYDGLALQRLRASQNGPRMIMNDTQASVDRVVSSVARAFYQEKCIEAEALTDKDREAAAQATKMTRHCIFNLNDGKMLIRNTVKAVAKYPLGGVLKIAREEKTRFSTYSMYLQDVDTMEAAEEQGRLIAAQNSKEDYVFWRLLKIVEEKYETPLVFEGSPIMRPSGRPQMDERSRYIAKFEIKKTFIEHNILEVPPEEFLLNKDAVDVDKATFVCQRRLMARSDIEEMWPDVKKKLGDATLPIYSQSYTTNYSNEKQWRRRVHQVLNITTQPAMVDKSMRQSIVLEGYIRYDFNNDGRAEWRKFAAIDNLLIENVVWDGPLPFILPSLNKDPYRPDEVTIIERSKDATLTKTALVRADVRAHMERSTTQIIAKMNAFPLSGQRKLLDGTAGIIPYGNNEQGAPNAQALQGNIQENVMVLQKPDPSQATVSMLQYMEIQRANQIGINSINDPNQSKTQTPHPATNAQIQQRNTDIAMEDAIMCFGETCMKPLFRKLWWFLVRDATHPCIAERFEKVTGRPCLDVERARIGDMDVRDEWRCNVGLGIDSPDYKQFRATTLLQLLGSFNQAMAQMMPNLLPKAFYAFQDACKALDYDPDDYLMTQEEFNKYMQALLQQKQQEQQNPPPPDPMVMAQVAFLQAQAKEAVSKSDKTQAEMAKLMAEVDKLRAEAMSKPAEVQLKLAQAEKERREASVVEMVAKAATEKKAQVST